MVEHLQNFHDSMSRQLKIVKFIIFKILASSSHYLITLSQIRNEVHRVFKE